MKYAATETPLVVLAGSQYGTGSSRDGAVKGTALRGVKAVITAADLPELPMEWVAQGPAGVDVGANQRVILAREKALYHGHAFAAVAASTREIAVEAGKLIEVEWEVLEPVLSIDQALAADAPILHEGQKTEGMGPPVEGDTNITNQIVFEGGDLDAGWADAVCVPRGGPRGLLAC